MEYVELRAALRFGIGPDVVGEAIVELADFHLRVGGQRRIQHLLWQLGEQRHRAYEHREQQGQQPAAQSNFCVHR